MSIKDKRCDPLHSRARLRRRRVVSAARNLSAYNGFHAAGVAQIAKASGVAVGQIYRDFGGKDDIVAAVVRLDCARLLEHGSLHHAIAQDDAAAVWEWIGLFVRPAVDPEARSMFVAIFAEATRNERIAAICEEMRNDVFGSMLAALTMLAPGVHATVKRDVLAELVLNQSLGLKIQILLQPDLDIDRLVDAIMTAIAREIKAIKAVSGVCSEYHNFFMQ